MSVVRDNMMTREGYTPYCGNPNCKYNWPRTSFDGQQFKCLCGWRSSLDDKFIKEYKAKWKLS